jgi:hypothetical protein
VSLGSSYTNSLLGNLESGGEGAVLLGTPKDLSSKALGMGVCVHGGPVLGNMAGCSFPRAFKRRVKFIIVFFIRRTLTEEFKRHVKEGTGIR